MTSFSQKFHHEINLSITKKTNPNYKTNLKTNPNPKTPLILAKKKKKYDATSIWTTEISICDAMKTI